ncbi:DEAD/DEAH box helicase family protein [Zooshikella sp. RANM57]|uniref:DEAD/DEAH box helicase n=1 Tax=Zooshikella sp. RANM57 TaxID=3425863 RepID=UPI003D6F7A1E
MKLRWYQDESLSAIYQYWQQQQGNPLVCVPTGGGKSVIIAEFIRRVMQFPNQRVLMLSHVKEILEQNYAKLNQLWPTCPSGIYSASLRRKDHQADVLFAGIQSVYNKAFDLGPFNIIIVDECHLINAGKDDSMYTRFLNDAKLMNPLVKLVGFTATPYRMKTGLLTEGEGALFNEVVYNVDIQKLIDQGFLSPLISQPGTEQIDLTNVSIRQGEFVTRDLEKALNAQDLTRKALKEISEWGQDRKAWLIFGVSVNHCLQIITMLKDHGIQAECVHGQTPISLRSQLIEDYKQGRIRCLVSQGVLTTGFDAPRTDLIAILRAIHSPGLYVQILGRGLRISPETDKTDCLVLDYGDNIERHGPIDNIQPPKSKSRKNGESGEAPTKQCPKCESLLQATLRECPSCGHAFPASESLPHNDQASKGALLKSQIKPVWLSVTDVSYSIHRKLNAPPSLKVTYRCGFEFVNEWVCFEHKGYAKAKAAKWWFKRAGLGGQLPRSTEEALQDAPTLKIPNAVQVSQADKYPHILNYDFSESPQQASA